MTSDGTYNYAYDAEGNITRNTTIATGDYVTYSWDYHNRLTDVETFTAASVLTSHVHYVYDVFDRLIGKQVDPTGGGTYTSAQWFVNSGDTPVLIFNISGALTDRLLVVPPSGGQPASQVLADGNASGAVSWLLPDNQGTIRDVAQYNSGTGVTSIVDHLKYDSFGNITAQSNSAYQPLFAYTGMQWDSAASLYYDHARWYDPQLGRFISQDPTSFAAGDVNLYRYVGNGPANGVDPTGLQEARTPIKDSDAELQRILAELAFYREQLKRTPWYWKAARKHILEEMARLSAEMDRIMFEAVRRSSEREIPLGVIRSPMMQLGDHYLDARGMIDLTMPGKNERKPSEMEWGKLNLGFGINVSPAQMGGMKPYQFSAYPSRGPFSTFMAHTDLNASVFYGLGGISHDGHPYNIWHRGDTEYWMTINLRW